jgi:hypothetical protein
MLSLAANERIEHEDGLKDGCDDSDTYPLSCVTAKGSTRTQEMHLSRDDLA